MPAPVPPNEERGAVGPTRSTSHSGSSSRISLPACSRTIRALARRSPQPARRRRAGVANAGLRGRGKPGRRQPGRRKPLRFGTGRCVRVGFRRLRIAERRRVEHVFECFGLGDRLTFIEAAPVPLQCRNQERRKILVSVVRGSPGRLTSRRQSVKPRPPSTTRRWPVTKPAASEAKKLTAWAMSSGVPIRAAGAEER